MDVSKSAFGGIKMNGVGAETFAKKFEPMRKPLGFLDPVGDPRAEMVKGGEVAFVSFVGKMESLTASLLESGGSFHADSEPDGGSDGQGKAEAKINRTQRQQITILQGRSLARDTIDLGAVAAVEIS